MPRVLADFYEELFFASILFKEKPIDWLISRIERKTGITLSAHHRETMKQQIRSRIPFEEKADE